jgi:hypothetical protein
MKTVYEILHEASLRDVIDMTAAIITVLRDVLSAADGAAPLRLTFDMRPFSIEEIQPPEIFLDCIKIRSRRDH